MARGRRSVNARSGWASGTGPRAAAACRAGLAGRDAAAGISQELPLGPRHPRSFPLDRVFPRGILPISRREVEFCPINFWKMSGGRRLGGGAFSTRYFDFHLNLPFSISYPWYPTSEVPQSQTLLVNR